MKIRGPVLASLMAPLGVLLPVLALGFREANRPYILADGRPDNGPVRALGVFLMALPVLYVVLVLLAAAIGLVLWRLGCRSLRKFLAASMGIGFSFGLAFGLLVVDPWRHGIQEALMFASFLAGAGALLSMPGASLWWFLAGLSPQPSVERMPDLGSRAEPGA